MAPGPSVPTAGGTPIPSDATAVQGVGNGTTATQGTDASAPTTAPRLPVAASPVEQIKVQLTKSALSGADTITMNLHPDDLGRVEVKLELQDGQLRATITADHPETLQLLKNDAANLQQSLQSAGLSTDSNALNFQLRGDQQQFAQGQGTNSNAGQSYAATPSSDDSSDDTIAAAALAASSSSGSASGLDISV
jgi:flagellar hook-length control protein FliK